MTITATPLTIRPHIMIAEIEDEDYGYRYWTEPMPKVKLDAHLYSLREGLNLSDYCCSSNCWCDPVNNY